MRFTLHKGWPWVDESILGELFLSFLACNLKTEEQDWILLPNTSNVFFLPLVIAVLSLLGFIFHIQFIFHLFKVWCSFPSFLQFPEVQDQQLHNWGCFLISLSSLFIFWDLQRTSEEVTIIHITSSISFWGLFILVKDGSFLVFPTGKLSIHWESSMALEIFLKRELIVLPWVFILSHSCLCPQMETEVMRSQCYSCCRAVKPGIP